ncbi:MAG: metallophosphoesterase [Telluria sp.]
MFSIILNVIGSLLHFYVASRLYKIGPIRERVSARAWWLGAGAIWLLYIAGIQLGDEALDWRWWPGQFAMMWIGIQFVMTLCLLVADLVTGFGLWWRSLAPRLIAVAAAAGVFLSAFAIYQAMRAPAVVEHELVLKDLPAALDGTVLVALTDLHLGAQRRSAWMQQRVEQINKIAPAAVLLVGDQVEDNPVRDAQLGTVLRGLKAPLGVYAVTGNHEFYGDVDTTIAEFEAGGVRWLRDRKVQLAPGLVLAGLDDIGRTMRSGGNFLGGLDELLPGPPANTATILLSHIPAPSLVENAAARGVDLMLSGHTHGGQIWPFSYLVKREFPLLVGAHKVGDMALVISRGAGSWGPRMRLWQPGEILKLTLRSPNSPGRGAPRLAIVPRQ